MLDRNRHELDVSLSAKETATVVAFIGGILALNVAFWASAAFVVVWVLQQTGVL